MPDETITKATRSDRSVVDDSLFGDAVDDKTAAIAEEQDSKSEVAQGLEGTDAPDKAVKKPQHSDALGKTVEKSDGLKVVLSIKGSRATIGVQQPSSDPHIESFEDLDESGLTQEVPAVIERARAGWEEAPKHPAYERPAPPAKRRNRRQQGATQASTAQAETEQAQQQALKLF